MKMRLWAVGFASCLALGFLCAGCAEQPLTLRQSPRSFTAQDYEKVYKSWTREIKSFTFLRLANVLHATVTFESWEFRWAYVTRYAADYAYTTEARQQMLQASLHDAQQFHRFYVTMVGENFRESDLSSQQSAWRVVMVDDRDRETLPVEISKIARPGATERAYFPSTSPFRFTFRLAFPVLRRDGSRSIPRGTKQTRIRFASAAGSAEAEWELQP